MKTYSALFAGFDLAGRGLEAAGLQPINLFEYDPVLAEVGQANSTGKYIVADVCDVDWNRYERPDVLWASPVCKNASVAKTNGEESGIDIATAEATGRAIATWLPDTVFIENVWGYRHFAAFRLLCDVLTRCGYWFQVHHLNSADYGVPQTRKRLIVRATRNGWLPPLPNKAPWRGWYQAIEDLIPGLPESRFADWQLARLPEALIGSFVHPWTTADGTTPPLRETEPMLTVTGSVNRNMPRAFLVDGDNAGKCGPIHRAEGRPTGTISGSSSPRAFLVGDQHRQIADAPEPSFTGRAGENGGAAPRAFIVDGQQTNPGKDSTDRENRTLITREETEPIFTVPASSYKGSPKAWLSQGRVVSMTPRALGRFQTLPDSFVLSGKASVDCTGIGNGVPCELVRRLVLPFLEAA